MGILISQYKDPYYPTSIMESRRVFFVAQVNGTLLVAGILRNAEAFLPQWRQKLETLSQYFAAESWVNKIRSVVGISVSNPKSGVAEIV